MNYSRRGPRSKSREQTRKSQGMAVAGGPGGLRPPGAEVPPPLAAGLRRGRGAGRGRSPFPAPLPRAPVFPDCPSPSSYRHPIFFASPSSPALPVLHHSLGLPTPRLLCLTILSSPLGPVPSSFPSQHLPCPPGSPAPSSLTIPAIPRRSWLCLPLAPSRGRILALAQLCAVMGHKKIARGFRRGLFLSLIR